MDIVLSNPVMLAAPIFFICVLLEIVYSKRKGYKNIYSLEDSLMNGLFTLGIVFLEYSLKFISAGALFYLVYDLFNPEINGVRMNIIGYESFGWAWYIWLLCQFLDEFSHYWVHRFNHTVRFMWAAHVVHHSSNHFNLGTSFRLSWIAKLYKPLFYAWLPAIGFHPEMVLVCLGIEIVWQFFLHTSYCPKLKWIDYIFVTPKQHQVHHAKNTEYLDKNHGAILNIFDRIFGTYKEYDNSIEIQYGLTHYVNLTNPADIILHEYRKLWHDLRGSKTLYEAIMFVFGPPGWSPDGSRLTVKQLQQNLT